MERFISLGTRSNIIYDNVTFAKRKDNEPRDFMKVPTKKELKTTSATECVTTCSILARNVELLVLDSDTTMNRGKTAKTTNAGRNALSVQLYASVDYKSMPSEIARSSTRSELNAFVSRRHRKPLPQHQ